MWFQISKNVFNNYTSRDNQEDIKMLKVFVFYLDW